MLRAGIIHPERPLAIMGLSEGNIERLRNGHPIHAELSSFVPGLPGAIAVFYGKTEADIEAMLREHGLVGPETRGVVDPRLDQEAEARRRHEKVLICTVGLPRSGKTTWSRRQAYPVVNPDSVRLAIHGQRFCALAEPFVWATAKAMVRALFLAGHGTVILDATNVSRKRRDEWRSEEWGTFFHHVDTPKDVCLQRAISAGDDEIIDVIHRMAAQYEPLGDDEPRWWG